MADHEDPFIQTDEIEDLNRTSSLIDWTGQLEEDFENDDIISETFERYLEPELPTSNKDLGYLCSERKRKRSIITGRVIDASLKPDVPAYLVKRSKKTPG